MQFSSVAPTHACFLELGYNLASIECITWLSGFGACVVVRTVIRTSSVSG